MRAEPASGADFGGTAGGLPSLRKPNQMTDRRGRAGEPRVLLQARISALYKSGNSLLFAVTTGTLQGHGLQPLMLVLRVFVANAELQP